MELIVTVVIGVIGLIFAAVQIYYARKQVSAPSAPAPTTAALQAPDNLPECRYLVVEGFTRMMWETEHKDVSRATLTIAGTTFTFDGGDVTGYRVFVLKGQPPGTYLFSAHFRFFEKPAYYDERYAADVVLDHSKFYLLKWNPFTRHSGTAYTRFVSSESISEDTFRKMTSFNVSVLPSCKAMTNSVTLL
jgi:hypothetical protein